MANNNNNVMLETFHKIYKKIKGYIVPIIFGFILFWSTYAFCSNFFVNSVYDFLIRLTAPEKNSEEIVVVAIDDESLNEIGRWPWKRSYYADIFEYLENIAGAKLIIFDSVITSYGLEEDDKEFFHRFSQLNKVIPGMFFSKNKLHFNKHKLRINDIFEKNFSIKVEDLRPTSLKRKSGYAGSSFSLKEIIMSSKTMGSVLSYPDSDGVIRKSEPVFYYNENYYPSLALAAFIELYPESEIILGESFLKIKSDDKKYIIPVFSEEDGSFNYIKWYKSGNKDYLYPYKTINAWKVIKSYENIKNDKEPLIDGSLFKDKIVVIGGTSTALMDIKSSPLGYNYPGVYIQATLIDNFINNDFMTKPSGFQEVLILISSLVLGFWAIFCLSPVFSSIILTFLAVGYFYICLFYAYPNNFALDPITPIVFLGCTALVGYGYKYFIEDLQRKKIKNLVAKYVSKDIMEEILKDPDKLKIKGKRSDISVLFVDIRNFTDISETMDPKNVSELLNEYFNELIPVIFKYKGTVNKFIGDAVMVIFGAPVEDSRHPENAVKCALEIKAKIKDLKVKWVLEENKPDINIGIGISTGEAFVGNIGADERFEYSAIGNIVNTASRLESFNKLYKTSILISESTFHRVEDIIIAVEIDSVHVAQNSDPIKIFELKSLK